jgi:hypothetical protein
MTAMAVKTEECVVRGQRLREAITWTKCTRRSSGPWGLKYLAGASASGHKRPAPTNQPTKNRPLPLPPPRPQPAAPPASHHPSAISHQSHQPPVAVAVSRLAASTASRQSPMPIQPHPIANQSSQ